MTNRDIKKGKWCQRKMVSELCQRKMVSELHIDKMSCEVRSDETQAAKRRLPVVKFSGVPREAGSGNMVEKGFCPRLLRQWRGTSG
jgi:hypothetical protein